MGTISQGQTVSSRGPLKQNEVRPSRSGSCLWRQVSGRRQQILLKSRPVFGNWGGNAKDTALQVREYQGLSWAGTVHDMTFLCELESSMPVPVGLLVNRRQELHDDLLHVAVTENPKSHQKTGYWQQGCAHGKATWRMAELFVPPT